MFPLYTTNTIFIFTHLITTQLQINNTFFTLPINFTSTIKHTKHININFYHHNFHLKKTINTFNQHQTKKYYTQYHHNNKQITIHHLLHIKTNQQHNKNYFNIQSTKSKKFLIIQIIISQPTVHHSKHNNKQPHHKLHNYNNIQ